MYFRAEVHAGCCMFPCQHMMPAGRGELFWIQAVCLRLVFPPFFHQRCKMHFKHTWMHSVKEVFCVGAPVSEGLPGARPCPIHRRKSTVNSHRSGSSNWSDWSNPIFPERSDWSNPISTSSAVQTRKGTAGGRLRGRLPRWVSEKAATTSRGVA